MDLDGDGINDLISGSWPGEIYFFKGRGHGQFDAPVKIKDKTGKAINAGGGVQKSGSDDLLVAGDAKFETKDGKRYIVYEGEWYEAKAGGGITGTASVVQAHDLNGDGSLDLVIGSINGDVYYVLNEGTNKAWSFGKPQPLLAGGKPIHVTGRAGPFVGDWDSDGKPDLVIGADDGSVQLYRNTGETDRQTKLPMFAEGRILVPAAVSPDFGPNAPTEPRRGTRSKVCIADWNGDGLPDLLVGDLTTQKPIRPEATPEQKAEYDKLRAELSKLQPRYSKALEDMRAKGLTDAEREKRQKEFGELLQEMKKIQDKIPQEYEYHGWVWLFQRKPR